MIFLRTLYCIISHLVILQLTMPLAVSIHTPMRAQRPIPWFRQGWGDHPYRRVRHTRGAHRAVRPLPFLPHTPTPPTTQRLYTQSEQSFIRAWSDVGRREQVCGVRVT